MLIPLTLVRGGGAPFLHCLVLKTRAEGRHSFRRSGNTFGTGTLAGCFLHLLQVSPVPFLLRCTCSFCHPHGTLQPCPFLMKQCKALMNILRSVVLLQGASSLPWGLRGPKSYVAASAYPEACFKVITEIHSPTFSLRITEQGSPPTHLSKKPQLPKVIIDCSHKVHTLDS